MTLPPGCNPLCPACAHRELSPAQSLTQKADWLSRRLSPWAAQIEPVRAIAEQQQWGYRDRISLSAQWHNGRWQFGVFRRDEFIASPDCPIHSERVRSVIALLSPHLPAPVQFPLAFVVQSGAQTVLIVKQAAQPPSDWLTDELIQQLRDAGVEGLWVHCFPAAGRNLFSKNGWHLLWGEARSRDETGYWYGPGAFSQLLPGLHEDSLQAAADFLKPAPKDKVVDLYCGRGISMNRWLLSEAQTIGVETGAEALACAKLNAPGAELLRGTCEHRIPQLQQWWQDADNDHRLTYVNPPRTGLEAAVSHWLGQEAQPARIAYLSCSAGTLARDLELLCQSGYAVEKIIPYDFFPRTYHVETLALLAR